jgi:hypothetical protein
MEKSLPAIFGHEEMPGATTGQQEEVVCSVVLRGNDGIGEQLPVRCGGQDELEVLRAQPMKEP